MKIRLFALSALLAAFVAVAQTPPSPPTWAFLVVDKDQPAVPQESAPRRMPGSNKDYTPAQIEDLANPPDWYPDDHKPAPSIIQHARGAALACGSCHLMSGQGHPESADLAGMPAEYIIDQMNAFKSGIRKEPIRMNAIAKACSDQDIRDAAEWFAGLKPSPWVKVVESTTVPKSYVSNKGRMRFALADAGLEPLGARIIELPQDPSRAASRDPHSGFVAYVPKGSVAKGEKLVKTGGGGKTVACALCHGEKLMGLGPVPRIAGLHPIYLVRQFYDFRSGDNNSSWSPLMKQVVEKLSEADMIDIAAYTASLPPAQ